MKAATLEDYRARMLRVFVFIQQNLDTELSLSDVAAVAHFSPYHFHRIFKGMVGETLQVHIRRIRLERAALRLRTTEKPITAIAFEAGYETHEAFSRAFRSLTGMTPSTFRTRHPMGEPAAAPSGVHYSPDSRPGGFEPMRWGGDPMDVTVKRLDPLHVVFLRHIGPYDECGPTWDALMMRVGAMGLLGPDVMMLGLCHDDPDVTPAAKLRYDACITVGDDFDPQGDLGVQTVSGGEYAVTTHQGPYDTLHETYRRLYGEWIPGSGRFPRSAPCFEVYLTDPESTEPDEMLTDIYAPLEPK